MEEAIASVNSKKMGLDKAAKYFEVPKETVHRRLTQMERRKRKAIPLTEVTSTPYRKLLEEQRDKAKAKRRPALQNQDRIGMNNKKQLLATRKNSQAGRN